jgi:hypothetical protein
MKMMKVHVTVWLLLLIGGFLAGFVPEYLKNRELRAQLEAPQKTIDDLKLQLGLGELRDEAGLGLLELSRQNYGLARDHIGDYYNKLKGLTETVQDPGLKKSLQDLSATHDTITADLASANTSALAAWQPIVLKTIEATKNGR